MAHLSPLPPPQGLWKDRLGKKHEVKTKDHVAEYMSYHEHQEATAASFSSSSSSSSSSSPSSSATTASTSYSCPGSPRSFSVDDDVMDESNEELDDTSDQTKATQEAAAAKVTGVYGRPSAQEAAFESPPALIAGVQIAGPSLNPAVRLPVEANLLSPPNPRNLALVMASSSPSPVSPARATHVLAPPAATLGPLATPAAAPTQTAAAAMAPQPASNPTMVPSVSKPLAPPPHEEEAYEDVGDRDSDGNSGVDKHEDIANVGVDEDEYTGDANDDVDEDEDETELRYLGNGDDDGHDDPSAAHAPPAQVPKPPSTKSILRYLVFAVMLSIVLFLGHCYALDGDYDLVFDVDADANANTDADADADADIELELNFFKPIDTIPAELAVPISKSSSQAWFLTKEEVGAGLVGAVGYAAAYEQVGNSIICAFKMAKAAAVRRWAARAPAPTQQLERNMNLIGQGASEI